MTRPPPYGPPHQPPPYGPPTQAAPPLYGPPPPYGPPPGFGPPGFPPPGKRRVLPVVIAVVAAVLLIGTAVLVPVLLTRGDDDKDRAGKGSDRSASTGSTVDTSNLDAVEEFTGLTNLHLPPGESPDYPQSPAVGGDHAQVWLECGVYDDPLPEVNVVHDLEHGTTWLTYRSDLVDAEGVQQLADQLPDNGIMSPYPDQEAPVVITVWGRQLELVGPEDPRIALFIAEYGAGDTAPEPFASCHGGADPEDVPGTDGADDTDGPVV